MKAFISENELVEEATPACVFPARLMQGAVIRLQAAPLCSEMVQYKKQKKKNICGNRCWKTVLSTPAHFGSSSSEHSMALASLSAV